MQNSASDLQKEKNRGDFIMKLNLTDKNKAASLKAMGIQLPAEDLPMNYFQELLNDQLGRDFFNYLQDAQKWSFPECKERNAYRWLRFDRLPIPPAQAENYDLMNKWQSVLSAAHANGNQIAFLLTRNGGETSIYLGAFDSKTGKGDQAVKQLEQTAKVHMQGAAFSRIEKDEHIQNFMNSLGSCGVVTGLPSSRFEKADQINLLQTMDRLTYGIREKGIRGESLERSYAVLVLAEPADDMQISQLMTRFCELRSDVHKYVAANVSENANTGGFNSTSVGASMDVSKSLLGSLPVIGSLLEGANVGVNVSAGKAFGKTFSSGSSVSHEERNYVAGACEELIEKHTKRLQNGRSLGFWNTGVYVLGDANETVDTVLGMLRSIYAGKESYIEPIRIFNAGNNAKVKSYLKNMQLLPLPISDKNKAELTKLFDMKNGWHVFGSLYESFSTPMNTAELSLATSLPRRDVPGLRFVRNAVKMAANAPVLSEQEFRRIHLGEVYDLGVPTGIQYYLDADSLVRHVLNDGITGFGKSTTTQKILDGLSKLKIPWLVIEPVKTDYVEEAIEHNKHCRPEEKIHIYMPGYTKFRGQKLETMQFNPFQPCAPEGALLNMQGHLDALASLLTASVSMGEVLPLLMKEALQELANTALGVDPETGKLIANSNEADPKHIQGYPKFSQLIHVVQKLMERRGYAAENHRNLTAAMETRIRSLLDGWKEDFFDAPVSTPGKDLFGRKVIINLIGIEADEDKAFFMSLILRALSEYRSSSYYYVDDYYKEMKEHGDRLMHFTVVEEAHRLIAAPQASFVGTANPQAATASMFSNMLREIRKWGEGLMIVDQQPSCLIPDAIKNTSLKIIHRMPAEDDRKVVGACMNLNPEQTELIAALERGQVILSSELDDAALWIQVEKSKK